LDIHLFAPHIPSPPGSARWAHWSLLVTLPEESKIITTRLSSSQVQTTRILSPSGFFILFFKKKKVLLCEGHVWRRISQTGTTVPKISYHHPWPSPMRPNELWTCPDTEPPGLVPGCQWRQLLGPFEEEEEGICITSDVVEVQGEDPATPGCLRDVRVRWCVSDFQSWLCALLARS